jgi:soluble lytic murein transglycosylase-like protein
VGQWGVLLPLRTGCPYLYFPRFTSRLFVVRESLFVKSAALLVLLPAAASADIYSFVDESGTAHYSNVPADSRYRVLIVAAEERTRAGEMVSAAFVIAAAKAYDPIIEAAASKNRIAPELLRAVIVVESGFNARAVSKVGARGLMQLMPETARKYGVRNVFDPAQNIHAGARLLADLSIRYRNDLELVLAAYNAGEAAVERHGRGIPPFSETRRYVPRVLGIYHSLTAANKSS